MNLDKLEIIILMNVVIIVLLIILLTKKNHESYRHDSMAGVLDMAGAGAINCDLHKTIQCEASGRSGCKDSACTACSTYDGSDCVPNECAKDNCM